MSPDANDGASRGTTRMPLETQVNIEFEKFSGFISEFSSNISVGGMFVKTNEPKPVGTVLSFEFKLADNFKLVQGFGEVIWVRNTDADPNKPAGMGIRFHEIDNTSKELITTMIDQYVKRGGKPFDLDSEGGVKTSKEEPKESSDIEDDFKALFSTSEAPDSQPPPTTSDDSTVSSSASMPTESPSAAPPPDPPPDDGDSDILFEEVETSSKSPFTDESSQKEEPAPVTPLETLEKDRSSISPDFRKEDSVARSEFRRYVTLAVIVAVGGSIGLAAFLYKDAIMVMVGLKEENLPVARKVARAPRNVGKERVKPTLPPETAVTPLAMAEKAEPQTSSTIDQVQPIASKLKPSSSTSVAQTDSPPIKEKSKTASPSAALEALEKAKTAESTTKTVLKPSTPTLPPDQSIAKASVPENPVTLIQKITWRKASNSTVVILRGNGIFQENQFKTIRIGGGNPRELVKILRITQPFFRNKIIVNSSQLWRVRTGYHPSSDGGELHVVLDLANSRTKVKNIDMNGSELHIHLSN